MIDVDGTAFFRSDDKLWKSDGTSAGTVLVKNLATFDSYPVIDRFAGLVEADGAVFFSVDDDAHGYELWSSDGTASGTTAVADLNLGEDAARPRELAEFDDTLFFSANDGIHGFSLWKVVDGATTTCNGVVATIEGSGAITGTAGDDVIVGSRRADTIDGRGGQDIVCGLSGSDTLVQGRRPDGADRLDGGSGRDWISYAARTGPVVVNLAGSSAFGGAVDERDDLVGVENVVGGAGRDVLVGSRGSNRLVGGGGGDRLVGGRGPDTVGGGPGNDTLDLRDGIRGNDTGDGGPGVDSALRDRGDRVTRVP